MSGFSIWTGRIAKPTAYPTDDCPIGAVVGRDYAVNNAMHYADIHAQNRVSWVSQTGAYLEGTNQHDLGWEAIWTGARFPISLRPDGSSYRCRVRVAGMGESASFKVKFAVSIGSPDAGYALYPASAETDAVWSTSDISSTTNAYRSGASLGTNAWTTMIAMTSSETAMCIRGTSTIVDVAGAPIAVTQAIVVPIVWAYVEDTAHQARLTAVSVEEWPG